MTQTRTRDPKPADPPTWEAYWEGVGNETYLVARELIELSSSVRAHFASFVGWHDTPALVDDPDNAGWSIDDPEGWVWRDSDLDWKAAAAAADRWAASSTERRLLDLVLSLVQPDEEHDYDGRATGTRMFDARDLGRMGSWADDVARILSRFIAG